ncbi:M60 family metallopeptidase [Pedobacter changchengzhani]|nr:M60 family metallopeptidase [Pedobacter changchengzhani]
MKHNLLTKLIVLSCISVFFSCKKYGYDVPDGYADASGNVANGQIDTNMKFIDKSLYGKARVFPGLVDVSEPRVKDAKFTLDLNFTDQTAQNLRIAVAPQPQFSTGYYAAPGELIKIVVPAGIEGLTMQIGGHTDDLSASTSLLRDPIIYMRQILYSGVNYVRNLYGGTIYINATRAYPTPVQFTISNAVVSPDFILGVSNDANWVAQVKASKVPWLELRSKRVIFLVPRDKIVASFSSAEPYTNPTATMTKWNEVFDLDYNGWMGLSDNAPDIRDRSPQGAWRGALDIQISEGYGHSGFPFMAYDDDYWFGTFASFKNVTTSQNMWGAYHEFGHNMQQANVWSWSTLTETTNNLFEFKIAKRIGADFSSLHPAPPVEFPKALAYAADNRLGKNFDSDAGMNDYFRRLVPFLQIFEKYGYGAMTYLYTEARHAPRLNFNDISKHNFTYEKLSDYARTDLAPFFRAWGITISDAVAAKVAGKYPALTTNLWAYNPLTGQGGNDTFQEPFTTSIVSVSSDDQGDGWGPEFLVDGDFSDGVNYWSSFSNNYPISIVIQEDNASPKYVKGVRFANRNPYGLDRHPGKIDIYTSLDNITYTQSGTFNMDNSIGAQDYIFAGGPILTKYVKCIIRNGTPGGQDFVSLSECNLIQP